MKTVLIKMKSILKKSVLGPILYELREFLCEPIQYLAIWKDLFYFSKSIQTLRARVLSKKIVGHRPKVLVASMSDSIFQIKIEGMLAAPLILSGADVFILTSSRINIWAHRYFRAFGIKKFIYWDELTISEEEKNQIIEETNALLQNHKTFSEWRIAESFSSWIGPQVLSTLARELYKGAPDTEDPLIRKRLAHLAKDALTRIILSRNLFKNFQAKHMFLIEANYSTMGPLVDVAIQNGVDVVQVVQPSRDDALYFKRLNKETRRHHPASIDKEIFKKISKMNWTDEDEEKLLQEFSNRYKGKWFLQARNQKNTQAYSKQELTTELGLDDKKPIVTLFSHILWDANLFYGEDLFLDYEDWFVQSIKAACSNSKVNWLIKLHPGNLWKRARDNMKGRLAEEYLIEQHIGLLPSHVKLLGPETKISTHSLFQHSLCGITVRGTVGMEMPCFGVPVINAGTGRYSGMGFTTDPSSKEKYLDILFKLPNSVEKMDEQQCLKAKKHAYAVFFLRPWVMESFECKFKYKKSGHHALDHNLFKKKNIDLKKNTEDLKSWSSWLLSSKAVDYIAGET